MSSVRRSAIGIQHAAVEVVAAVMPSVYARRLEPEKNAANVQSVCTDETAMCGATRKRRATDRECATVMDTASAFRDSRVTAAANARRIGTETVARPYATQHRTAQETTERVMRKGTAHV